MLPRDARVRQAYVVVGATADAHALLVERDLDCARVLEEQHELAHA
jgi:hypothetical protein